MQTLHDRGDLKVRALSLGFDRYLTKPVDARRLSTLVAELARARVVAGS